MPDGILVYIMGFAVAALIIILMMYFFLKKRLNKSDLKRIKQLRTGTEENKFSFDVIYQRLYILLKSFPITKRYLYKIRRRLEIIYMQDEYKTRRESAKIMFSAMIIIVVVTIIILSLTKDDILLRVILLFFEAFLIETITTGTIDKLDTKILKEQIGFFAEIRHAYNEYGMVEEAIYEASQNDELEVSKQGEKIYEILISDDPETELEKYYDVAPNAYLKEFAGVSYLTKEFGDRFIDGASLYLKNLNNITQEMQLEILKRDKLDYKFKSLSFIAIAPVLLLTPLRNWAIGSFSFTQQFYNGKGGLIVEVLLLILTFVSYVMIRKIKDTGSIKDEAKDQNKVWQMRLYNISKIKPFIDLFIPSVKSKEYRKNVKLMKDAAAKQKMETLYVNRISLCIVVFIVSIIFFGFAHKVALDYIYNQPVANYDLMGGSLSEYDYKIGMEKREIYNKIIQQLKGRDKITEEVIRNGYIEKTAYFKELSDTEKEEAAEQIFKELKVINREKFRPFELIAAMVFAWIGYEFPVWFLIVQKKLRTLEMENEVMQFQTIITMLMKIERVNVEIILEWIERYSNIFREPITKCVNNYEAGAWEALEELKNDISFPQLIRLIESMQAAVEKIPIEKAFEELENERDYYQEKRKESNERLISKKGMIGKFIGFTPMVVLFVGYLIIPMMVMGVMSISGTLSQMTSMI